MVQMSRLLALYIFRHVNDSDSDSQSLESEEMYSTLTNL